MRLTEEKIKQAILHADPDVREMAILYFDDSFSTDTTVMPLVIQAIEKYGHEGFSSFTFRHGLAQTDETLLWMLAQLAREGDPEDEDWSCYSWGLLKLLTHADAHLLARHQSAILEMKRFGSSTRATIAERIRLLAADPGVCWAHLWDFCDREKTKHYISDVDLNHANRLVEAIARHGDRYTERVLSILAEKVEDFTNHPMGWLEPLTVRLAGEMRCAAAMPLIVQKLHEEGDLLLEECEVALWKIGNEAVVDAVCADYSQSEWSYRLYGVSVLEHIHSDLTVRKALDLLAQEDDGEIRTWLGQVLLRQFASEAVEPLRQLILAGPLDPEMLQLRKDYLTACTLMEVTFPEMEQWRKELLHDAEANKAFFAKHHLGMAKLANLLADDSEAADEEDEIEYDREELPVKQKVGRNEPCPCGSGKKFKKCCLRKQGDGLID